MTVNQDNLKKIQDAYHTFQDTCGLIKADDDCDVDVADAIQWMLHLTSDGLGDIEHYSEEADKAVNKEEAEKDEWHKRLETLTIRGQ